MTLTTPTVLTLLRIALIPFLVLFFYLPFAWSNMMCVTVFVLAAATDWADGFIARKMGQMSEFGAILDPLADKLMVATALILLVQRQDVYEVIFALSAAIIVGREMAISALREWLAKIGERARVHVSWLGKVKTGFQMTAIGFLLYHDDILGLPIAMIGEWLLYTAAALTLWSLYSYMKSAWPVISDARYHTNSAEVNANDKPSLEAASDDGDSSGSPRVNDN